MVRAGNYSAQRQALLDEASKDRCLAPVQIEAAPGARAVFGTIDDNIVTRGASWVTFTNLDVTDTINLVGASHITLSGIQGGTVYIGGAQHVLIEDSRFGPCYSGTPVVGDCTTNFKIDSGWQYAVGGPSFTTDGVIVRHNTLADYVNNANSHFECMFIRGGENIVIDANVFHVCQHYGIFLQPATAGYDVNTTIENNLFDETEDFGMRDNRPGAVDVASDGPAPLTRVLIRFNSFAPYDGVFNEALNDRIGPGVQVVGNIGGDAWYHPCIGGITYADNLWNGSRCGTTDRVTARLPYVDSTRGHEDFHLRPHTVADGMVTADQANLLLGTDFYGNVRPITAAREPGAIESQEPPRAITVAVTPDHSASGAVRLVVHGRVRLPAGLPSSYGCTGRVLVVAGGGEGRGRLEPNCTFLVRVKPSEGDGTLGVAFLGNGYVAPMTVAHTL